MRSTAGLQAAPGAVDPGRADDGGQRRQRAIEAAPEGDQVRCAVRVELDAERDPAQGSIQTLDCVSPERRAVMREQETAQSLADLEGPLQIGIPKPRAPLQQAALPEPASEMLGIAPLLL